MILPLKPLYIYQNERLMQYKSDMTQINNPRFSRPFPCQLIENGSLKQPIYCSIWGIIFIRLTCYHVFVCLLIYFI